MEAVKWNGDSVTILDQRLLPLKEVYNTYKNYTDVAYAIKSMETRGAPAIGITAGMGIALAAKTITAKSLEEFKEEMEKVLNLFASTRPTAVNLFWTINRMRSLILSARDLDVIKSALKLSYKILEEDIAANKQMGKRCGSWMMGILL